MVDMTGPDLKDFYLIQNGIPRNVRTGRSYSYYTSLPSLLPIPVIFVSRIVNGGRVASDRGAFVLANSLFGALIGPLLLAFYRRLGLGIKLATFWTLTFSLTTLWWNGSDTVFDQCQHGVLMLAMFLVAFKAAETKGLSTALGAGLLGGLLFNARVPFMTLLPVVPVFWLLEFNREGLPKAERNSLVFKMTALFAIGVGVGLAGYLYYNFVRFDSIFAPAYEQTISNFGNPINGLLTLLISPGKGILWFSPPLIFAILGYRYIPAKYRNLKICLAVLCTLHLLEMSCLSFAGGDWCWGPRYMLPIMPLMALAMPFCQLKLRSAFTLGILGLGLLIQLMGLSVENHRFFFYRRLDPHFWTDPWAYFRFSQLVARPSEIFENLTTRDRVRPKINSNTSGDATYAPFGPPPPHPKPSTSSVPRPSGTTKSNPTQMTSEFGALMTQVSKKQSQAKKGPIKDVDPRIWQEDFSIFYLPKPWWGWINHVPADQRPFNPAGVALMCLLLAGVGGGVATNILRKSTLSLEDRAESLNP